MQRTKRDTVDDLLELNSRICDCLIAGKDQEYIDRLVAEFNAIRDQLSQKPIPVTERLPEEGETALFYFPYMAKIWSDDGTDPFIAEPETLHSGMGQWLMLRVEGDGWLRCYGTQLKSSDTSHWLPMPPKPE